MNNLGLEPKHEKHGRLYHFFKDILGEDKTRPRTECDWHDPKSQRMKRWTQSSVSI